MPYVFGHQNKGKHREANTNWKGGRKISSYGYVYALAPDHPRATANGYVFEHILVAEAQRGGYLPEGHEVHHLNRVRTDNRPENLVVCANRADHFLLHKQQRALEATGDPNSRKCCYCKQWETVDNIHTNTQGRTFHKSCKAEYDRRRNARHAIL